MFKRGDIGRNEKHMVVITGVPHGIQFITDYIGGGQKHFPDGRHSEWVKYTGPIYKKGGRRFVPSGEYRLVMVGDWYKSEGGPNSGEPIKATCSYGYRAILLPVPALPEEHPCDFCDGKGELLTICERCHGTGGLTKPEFEVGDWVKNNKTGRIVEVDNSGFTNAAGGYTKLPGRPLTTDDLMQVQSGKRIIVECHAECCVKGKGHPVSGGIIYNIFKHTTYFFHANQFHQVLPSAALAEFKDGSIVFAPNVEGNIYVVEG